MRIFKGVGYMNILIYSQSAETYCDSLIGLGYTARPLWQNDLIVNVVNFEPPDCIIYDLRDAPVIPHEDVLKNISDYRIIIIGKREDTLIPYLAGLGVRDFLFTPINPEDIVYRVENPASPAETAELLKTVPGLQPERIIEIIETVPEKPQRREKIKTETRTVINDVEDDEDNAEEEIPRPAKKLPKLPEISIPDISMPNMPDMPDVGGAVSVVGDSVVIGFNYLRIMVSSIIIFGSVLATLYVLGVVFDFINMDGTIPSYFIYLKDLINKVVM